MTKSVNKIVSAILVMAICLTTVFGCLITVSAAEATGNYTITSDDVPSGARTATTYVTLTSTSEAGFSSGKFDLMFDDSLLDTNYDKNETFDEFYARDIDKDYMIAVQDTNGNFVFDDGDVKENANNKGTRLPNAYDEPYVDGIATPHLYDTKIEIVDGTKTSGEFSLGDFYSYYADAANELATDSAATNDETNKIRYRYNATTEYIESQKAAAEDASDEEKNLLQLGKYYRSYSTVDVATESLSYAISTVSEDSEGLVARYTQYAQGFKGVTFDAGENTYTSITFKVTFDFSGRTDRMSANSVPQDKNTNLKARTDGRYCGDNQVQLGLNYQLNLTPASEIASFTDTNTTGEKYNNFHIHRYYTTSKTEDLISNDKDYAIYQGYCPECQDTDPEDKAPMIAPSFVADRLAESAEDEANDGVGSYYFHNYKNIYGFNVVYEKDGTLSVNIHFDEYSDGDTFVIGLSDGTKTKYSEFGITDPAASFFATVEHWDADGTYVVEREVRALRNSAKMVTIEGLSAKDIDTQLYIARMGKDGDGKQQIGRTHVFSLADYCMKVINEQDVYYVEEIITSDNTVDGIVNNTAPSVEEQKAHDKNVAAALINYGKAAKAALEQDYDGIYAPTDKTVYWDGGTTAPTDSDNDGIYEINTAEELAYIAKNANSDTAGNTYKVADDIDMIVLQKKETIEALGGLSKLTGLADADAVQSFFESNASSLTEWIKVSANNSGFAGTFDGNGATICGMFQTSAQTGLFSRASADITVKNVTLKNNYVYGDSAAVICGQSGATDRFTVNNCVLTNNVVIASRNDKGMAYGGVMFGKCSSCKLTVDNCLVYGNIAKHSLYAFKYYSDYQEYLGGEEGYDTYHSSEYNITYGLYGDFNGSSTDDKNVISNSIILDAAPYAINDAYNVQNHVTYTNVYTNMTGMTLENYDWASTGSTANNYKTVTTINSDGTTKIEFYNVGATSATFTFDSQKIYKIDHSGVLGNAAVANMPNLDWSKWSYGAVGSYPTPTTSAAAETVGETWYWDNTTDSTLDDNGEEGTSWDTAIIIDSAAELAYLCREISAIDSTDKYYKIKDGVDSIVLQSSDYGDAIKALDSADKVQDYFDDTIGSDNRFNWMNSSTNGVFNGKFDGNGATVYGLFAQATSTRYYCGLFHGVDGGSIITEDGEYNDADSDGEYDASSEWVADAVDNDGIIIKNITVKNSYFDASTTTKPNRRVGAIVAECYSSKWGAACAGTVNLDSCSVINCYLTTNSTNKTSGGVMHGNPNNEVIKINNALVYGNNAKNTDLGWDLPLSGGSTSRSATVENNGVYDNCVLDPDGNYYFVPLVTNSVVLGTTPYSLNNFSYRTCRDYVFENVYTDQPAGTVTYLYNGNNISIAYAETDIKQISASDLIGANAQSVVKAINDANGDSRDMYVGAIDGYPSFSEVPSLTTDLLGDYAAMTFEYDSYGASTTEFGLYATSLNLKVNPYMSFTFAFHGDHKTSRDEIKVTFTTDSENVHTANAIPAYTGEDIVNVDGWTNRYPAGRYHLYRLTDVDVVDLCNGITINATHGSDTFVAEVSVGGFVLDLENAYKADPCKYYSTRIEAAKALLFYTQMVNARYA